MGHEIFDRDGLVGLLRRDRLHDGAEARVEGRRGKGGGEIDPCLELLAGELHRGSTPGDFCFCRGESVHFQGEAVEVFIKTGERKNAAGAAGIGRARVVAERPAGALEFDGAVGLAHDGMAIARGRFFRGEINGDRADRTVETECLEKGRGHKQLAGRGRVEAVAAEGSIGRTEGRLGLGKRLHHAVVDIGEVEPVLCGETPGNVAELRERRVVDFAVEAGEKVRINAAGRADRDVGDSGCLEPFDDAAHVSFVGLADRLVVGLVAAVVHPIAGCRDIGTEDGEVIGETIGKTVGAFSAPAELEDGDVLTSDAGEEVGLDVF